MRLIPVVSKEKTLRWLPIDEIDFIEPEGRSIKVYSGYKEYYLVSKIDDLRPLLTMVGFCRTDGKGILNSQKVKFVNREKKSVILENGRVILFSRANFERFEEMMGWTESRE